MIGLLYESHEWSDFKLAHELEALGHSVCMIDMTVAKLAPASTGDSTPTPTATLSPSQDSDALQKALSCTLLASRVFASAQFRGNNAALDNMLALLKQVAHKDIILINPAQAHCFEIDKQLATQQLADCGLSVPLIYTCDLPENIHPSSLMYPCMIKPNCGGRSNYSAVVTNPEEARLFLKDLPSILFLVEEFIVSDHAYLLRAELVGHESPYVYRRSIGTNGLSSYHCGSTYERETTPPPALLLALRKAAEALSFELGSFDIIEQQGNYYFIDANAVTNVSEDCNELLGMDLMKLHASYISERYQEHSESHAT